MRDFRDEFDEVEDLSERSDDDGAQGGRVAAALDLLTNGPTTDERVLAIHRLGSL